LLYVFFWVIPQRLNFICRRFGTLCSIFIGWYQPMKMEQTECSETSAYKIQTLGNYPKENMQHTEHGEILKSRTKYPTFITSAVEAVATVRVMTNAQGVLATTPHSGHHCY